jgi:hypothetical protein
MYICMISLLYVTVTALLRYQLHAMTIGGSNPCDKLTTIETLLLVDVSNNKHVDIKSLHDSFLDEPPLGTLRELNRIQNRPRSYIHEVILFPLIVTLP